MFSHVSLLSGGYMKDLTESQLKNVHKLRLFFIHGDYPPVESALKDELDLRIKLFKSYGAKSIKRYIYRGMPHTFNGYSYQRF
jgi:hypothetical protein